MQFGSHDGTFRIYPARQSNTCGNYDPRLRPWYIAASSGPKNIIMVLDVSGSMEDKNNLKLNLLKQAATRVVQTLTVGDRVAIIPFSSSATVIGDSNGHMMSANAENIASLVESINGLAAGGNTNFQAAFQKAFDRYMNEKLIRERTQLVATSKWLSICSVSTPGLNRRVDKHYNNFVIGK